MTFYKKKSACITWKRSKLKFLAQSIINGTTSTQLSLSDTENLEAVPVTRIETISTGVINLDKIGWVKKNTSLSPYKYMKGDILFSHINSLARIGNCAYFQGGGNLYAGMNLLRIRPKQTVNAKWLYYNILSSGFDALVTSHAKPAINQASLSISTLNNFELLVPLHKEQTAIANFLDQKTTQIDAAIAQKEQLIELLKERKQIIIQRAVTRGLDETVTMKDSGVDWIGEVPGHWTVLRAKYVFEEINERSEEGTEELLSVSHTTGVTPRADKNINMFQAEDYSGSKLCQPGDLVINTMWAWMGAMGVSKYTGIVSPSYGVYRQLKPSCLYPEFLEELLKHNKYIAEYNRISTGLHSSRLRLYPPMFMGLSILIPPMEEQERIVSKFKSESTKIDLAIQHQTQQIAKLREYRTVLIDAAVTGKIKVG